MKHSIDYKKCPSEKQIVSSVTITLTIETQGEFTRLKETLGRGSTQGAEFDFYDELSDLYDEVEIKQRD